MHICPKSDVVRQVPAHVIGILVNHDRITIPEPVIYEAVFKRRHAEIVAVEPETLPVPALQTEDMATSKPAGKVSMFPRMIEVEAKIMGA